MKIEKLEGLVAAPYTPMDANGNLNLRVIEKYSDHLIKSGIVGVFVCGTTGEGFSMTTMERKKVLEFWINTSGDKLKVICHVGSNCLAESRELALHAQEMGAYAIGCIAPTFYKPSNATELVDFLGAVAAAAPALPFFYYNFPALTGVDIKASQVFVLASGSIPNFAGVKFTHSDFYDMQKCLAFEGGRFNVLNGFDEMLLCGLSIGATAAVGSTYNFMAVVYNEIRKAFISGDLRKARELQQFSVKVVDILVKYRGATIAGKSIMSLIGIDCGPCRLPVRGLSESDIKLMKSDLELIDFFRIASAGESAKKEVRRDHVGDLPLLKK